MEKKIIQNLEDLFAISPPSSLRSSINKVFYACLINNAGLPSNQKQISEDFYALNEFLERAENCTKNSQNKRKVNTKASAK